MTEQEKTVTITVDEYEELISDSKFLQALVGAGVDNWDGYEYACEIFQEGV